MKTEPNLNEPTKADEEKMEQDPTLSHQAQAVYNHLRREAFLGRAMPTRRAIANWLKIKSLTSVDAHLKQLASRDLVEILPGQQRGLVLKGTGEVPLLYVDGHGPLRRRLDPEADVIDRMSGAVAKRFRGATCFLQLGHYGMNVPGFTEGAIVALDTKAQRDAVSDGSIVVVRINEWIRCRVYRRVDERFAEFIDVDRDAGPLPQRVDLQNESVVLEGVVLGCLQMNRLTMFAWYRELQPWFERGGSRRQGTNDSHTAN